MEKRFLSILLTLALFLGLLPTAALAAEREAVDAPVQEKLTELEQEYILQRQSKGITIAKSQMKCKGRKPIERPKFNQVTAL